MSQEWTVEKRAMPDDLCRQTEKEGLHPDDITMAWRKPTTTDAVPAFESKPHGKGQPKEVPR